MTEQIISDGWANDEVCKAWIEIDDVVCQRERDGSREALLASFARRRESMPQGVKEYISRWAEKISDELYDSGALVEPGDPGRGYRGIIKIDSSGITYE